MVLNYYASKEKLPYIHVYSYLLSIYTCNLSSTEELPASFLQFSTCTFSVKVDPVFFCFSQVFQIYRESEKPVKHYKCFTSFLKTAAGSLSPFFSQQQPVPKRANPDRIIKKCEKIVKHR